MIVVCRKGRRWSIEKKGRGRGKTASIIKELSRPALKKEDQYHAGKEGEGAQV